MDRRVFLSAAGGLMLAGPAQAQLFGRGSSGPSAIVISSRGEGLANATSLFTRAGPSVIAPGARIIAPFMTFELVEEVGKTVRERQYRAGAVASSKFTVEGINDADIQLIVDRIYADCLTSLTTAGYAIVTRDEARANADYAKLIATEKPPLWRANTEGGGKSKFFAPTGMGPYFSTGDPRFGAFAGLGISMAQAFSEQNAPVGLNASLMFIDLAVGFVNVATQGGGQYSNLFGTGIASVRGKAVMALMPERTQISFKSTNIREAKTYLKLNRPVGPANNPITAFEDITSNASKATDLAAGLIGALAGGGPSYQTRAYRIALDPVAFPVALEGCLTGVSAAMISQVGVAGATGRR